MHEGRAATLARLPSLQVSTTYQRFAYPPDGTFLPSALDLYFPNWNVTLGLSVPVLTGGRLRGERMVAEANLAEARQRARFRYVGSGLALGTKIALTFVVLFVITTVTVVILVSAKVSTTLEITVIAGESDQF